MVININDAPLGWRNDPKYVYIGRPQFWGNPIVRGEVCIVCGAVHTKNGSTLDCYKWWLLTSNDAEPQRRKLKELRGKILVCYCKPYPCHGDVLQEALKIYSRRI